MRDKLFLSHASPEDNEFTRWLALQLAKEGYPVWCDLTQLLGGENFWNDIEQAIRERTVKFLYVLSRTSNRKPGPLKELQVADTVMRYQALSDFIVPLLIDDLPPAEINIWLSSINAVPFNQGWAQGLNILLEKLARDGVSKNPLYTPTLVANWWREQFDANKGLLVQPEEHLSNWFPIKQLPEYIYFHALRRTGTGKVEVTTQLPYPAFQHNIYLVSFAPAKDFTGKLGFAMSISESSQFSTVDFLEGNIARKYVDRKQARDFVHRLLRMGWEAEMKVRKLPTYELANKIACIYFTKGMTEGDKISFTGVDSRSTHRNVVGYKTMQKAENDSPAIKRYWHFGIDAKPIVYPVIAYVVRPHVLFSTDGSMIWESKSRLHSARRRQCKDWWNPDWRDRILATLHWLADAQDNITIPLGSDVSISVSAQPIKFSSPVSFTDPADYEPILELDDDDDVEEENDEENDE